MITWSDFEKVDLRVGVVVDAKEFPEAKQPAYRLWVDLGPLGIKRYSAQITDRYRLEDLLGRQVVGRWSSSAPTIPSLPAPRSADVQPALKDSWALGQPGSGFPALPAVRCASGERARPRSVRGRICLRIDRRGDIP